MIQGIGLGLRKQFADELLALGPQASGVDFLEVTPENWVFHGGARRKLFEACIEAFPTVSHSVSLSVGGLDPLDEPLLRETKALVLRARSPWWSDHLCYSSVRGAPLHDLLPLPFTEEALRNAARRAKECEERVGAPLVLENATFYSHMPGGEMDEAAFLSGFLRESGCGMLLDINNVWVNAQNHKMDARAFIDAMPLAQVRQLHVAGHTRQGDTIIDTHIGPVIDPVWELYRYTLARAGRLIPTLVEWDQQIPPLGQVLAEVHRARAEAKLAGVLA